MDYKNNSYLQQKMQENLVLRQVTNLPLNERGLTKKQSTFDTFSQSSSEDPRPLLEDLIKISTKQVDFGYCLSGSIHEKVFAVSLLQDLEEAVVLSLNIVCEDEALEDSASLIFGVKRANQQQFYDDYQMKIKSKRSYEFKIGVKTPMLYQYDVKCVMYITFADYAPLAVILKQRIQIPEIICTKQLYFEDKRVIKLSTVQNRGKKECRVPFKMNHPMTISVTAQVIGLTEQTLPIIDVKPKSMTLAGKGQFTLLLTMNTNKQIKGSLEVGVPAVIRKILTLKIKDTNFMYHFPIEAVYYPDAHKKSQVSIQEF